MGVLKDRDKKALTKIFGDLTGQVKLVMFTQEVECDYCHLIVYVSPDGTRTNGHQIRVPAGSHRR